MTFIVAREGKSTWSLPTRTKTERSRASEIFSVESRSLQVTSLLSSLHGLLSARMLVWFSPARYKGKYLCGFINVLFRNLLRCKNLCNVKFYDRLLFSGWRSDFHQWMRFEAGMSRVENLFLPKETTIRLVMRIDIVAQSFGESYVPVWHLTFRAVLEMFRVEDFFKVNKFLS